MYKILLTIFLLVAADYAQAQTINGTPTFNEIFRQKKTQKKYLRKQIALLQTYCQFLKKGYEISQSGLNFIGQIKDGNFTDHQSYFASIAAVKPAIKHSADVSVSVDLLDKTNRNLHHILSGPYKEEFTSSEWQEVTMLCEEFTAEATLIRESLVQVISDGELQMTDDERLQRIGRLRKKAESIHRASREFFSTVQSLWRARAKEKGEINLIRTLTSPAL